MAEQRQQPPGTSESHRQARRRLVKALAAAGGAFGAATLLPTRWTKPVIDSILVPLHAQGSPINGLFSTASVPTFSLVDLVVPRGGPGLIDYVRRKATMPVVAHGDAVVQVYVDEFADVAMAVDVVDNAKTRRYSICNAVDTVLVHAAVAPAFLRALCERWGPTVTLLADERARSVLADCAGTDVPIEPAREEHWRTEHLALRAGIRIVTGPAAGRELDLAKPMTTLGKPGKQVAAITRRQQGYFVAHVEGDAYPLLNGAPIGPQGRLLREDDVVEVAGIRMQFFLRG